ncbi:nucleoside 2-deoxyribosyltransferase domain-containing protein [Amycolatopsis sp. NPDC058278]|uniref:nucleoside 2-deoxyribosyltransferase domain-containing protein n=1 Tax=unclassified Amycolatopsis TaxID=2618356 RepID=UPI00255BF477|nr:nucleoside 2-deoxyribosyltransferase domain-containing protein [Amycolatopsis sp. DG1A-15b]WIX91365.1 nucleoside 2-deoxyribosyltransferase domain-containing protein [Amycolatopsis sp. DG1A-15b]
METDRYVEAPTYHRPRPGDPPSVFLAGGITAVAEPWHEHAVRTLLGAPRPLIVFNPCRADFPIHDPGAAFEQVSWEQHHLRLAGLTLFWFPRSDAAKTTQPIALFELGQALGEGRRIVVGADPGYPREHDVHLQCRINRPGMPVWSTVDDTLTAAIEAAHG